MHDSVIVHMRATPDVVWQLISDVTQIGRWSPETFEAEWLGGATAPAVGTQFRGHVKRNGVGPIYWTTCEITACEPGREFAFTVLTGGKPTNLWRYELRPVGDGVDVTESFTLADMALLRLYWVLLGWTRGRTNVRGMQQTLERVKSAAEAGS
jgi:uncharacterized protein YndB with AHSA1/START domain